MNIKIKNYTIRKFGEGLVVERSVKGRIEFVSQYKTLSEALNCVIDELLLDGGYEDLQSIIERIDALKNDVLAQNGIADQLKQEKGE